MKARLLLIDNYDSFTYNLVQAFLVLGAEVSVYRNDALTPAQAAELAPTHLCISPGPGTPYDAGVSMDMIRAFAGRIPVLGVCLGHQSIVEVFGGKVVRAERLMHGKTSPITHDGRNYVVDPAVCHYALAVMTTAGLYETSGDWLFDIGLPGKSGIGGGIVTVSPGKGGLGTFAPPLDSAGNSVKGQLVARFLSQKLGMDLFASQPEA